MTPTRSSPFRYPGLDILRVVAIFLVFMLHFQAETQLYDSKDVLMSRPRWLALWDPTGQYGVDIFFVLSGYLVFGNLLRSFSLATWGQSIVSFWIRRASRTFVPYWIIVVLLKEGYLWFEPFGIKPTRDYAAYFVYMKHYAYVDPYPFIHAWSLCAEELFYFLAPILLCLSVWIGVRGRFLLVGIVVLFSPLMVGLKWYSVPEALRREVFYFTPHYRMFGLALGCLVAAVRYSKLLTAVRCWSLLLKGRWYLFSFGIVAVFLIAFKHDAFNYLSRLGAIGGETGFCLAIASLLPVLASWKVREDTIPLYAKVLRFMAVRVYGAYLIHFPLIILSKSWFKCGSQSGPQECLSILPEDFRLAFFLVSLVTFLGATLLYSFVEKPLVSLGDRLIERLKRGADVERQPGLS
ncbi:MAG: acyltransferase [Alphaproteobacteria bacterium]|nr:MAG: acyltransferase [Alphaproteobacteria bacterium]